MLIRSVTICNVLSFKQETIRLNGASFLMAIGPNGSGKSNFIEIVTKLLEKLIVIPIAVDDQELWNQKTNPTYVPSGASLFAEHKFESIDLPELEVNVLIGDVVPSVVDVEITLSDREMRNVQWLIDNTDELLELLRKTGPRRAIDELTAVFEHRLRAEDRVQSTVIFRCKRAELQWILETDETFSSFYIHWFKLLRWASYVTSDYPELSSLTWPELGELVAILGSHRSYHSFVDRATTQRVAWADYVRTTDRNMERSSRQIYIDEPASFDLFRRSICRVVGQFAHDSGYADAIERALSMPQFVTLNKRLQEFLNLRLELRPPVRGDSNIRFIFKRDSTEQFVSRLSSGEKALLQLIFAVYWSGSQDVMLLIDEPELHLHPQFHRSFVAILKRAIVELQWQIVIATHSPGFLCEEYPGGLLCFRHVEGYSRVHTPKLTSDDKELMRLIDYENSARLLFTRKVVLVEGHTDAFFFAHYLRQFATKTEMQLSKLDEVAFFPTVGKGERERWVTFLQKLDIEVFCISDLDAVLEVDPTLAISLRNDTKTQKKIDSAVKSKGSRDGWELFQAACKLVEEARIGQVNDTTIVSVQQVCDRISTRKSDAQAIRDLVIRDVKYRERIEKALSASRGKRHLILKDGELEDYISCQTKGLDVVIDFCRSKFENWYCDPSNGAAVAEICGFMQEILHH